MWDYTGEQYCPSCHKLIERGDDGKYECDCGYYVSGSDLSDPEYYTGYPTLESSYSLLAPCKPDIPVFISDELDPDEYAPEGCSACDGSWPDCCESCPLYDDGE